MIHDANAIEYSNVLSESAMNELISNTEFRYIDKLKTVTDKLNIVTTKLYYRNKPKGNNINDYILININISSSYNSPPSYFVNVIIDDCISSLDDNDIPEYLTNAAIKNIGIITGDQSDYTPIVHRYKYQTNTDLVNELPSINNLI